MKKVAIIMGSDSDLPIVEKGIKILDSFSVPYEVHVYSAHRTPEEAGVFASNAKKNGFGVIIAAAGRAAHLAGAIAGNVIEDKILTDTAFEFLVQEDKTGNVISVVQSNELQLQPGDHVILVETK